jgi:hypothetical protein
MTTKRLTLHDVQFASRMSQSRIKSALDLAKKLTEDPRLEHRLARQECGPCFYTQRIAGQAFTGYTCELCQNEHKHHNTAVPKICQGCASHNGLCARCCADMEGAEAAAARTDEPVAKAE